MVLIHLKKRIYKSTYERTYKKTIESSYKSTFKKRAELEYKMMSFCTSAFSGGHSVVLRNDPLCQFKILYQMAEED